jgi:HSP20 family protein
MTTATTEAPEKVEKKAQGLTREAAYRTPAPFALMREFSRDFERLFEDLWPGRFAYPARFMPAGWMPDVEAVEEDGRFVVRADLPGLKKDEIKVELTADALVIEGERKRKSEEKREGYYRSERSYGSFHRIIPLPEAASIDTAKASFKDGVLEVTIDLPKRVEAKPKKLEIKE